MRQGKTPPCARTDGLFFVQPVEQYVGLMRTPLQALSGPAWVDLQVCLSRGFSGQRNTSPGGIPEIPLPVDPRTLTGPPPNVTPAPAVVHEHHLLKAANRTPPGTNPLPLSIITC